MQDNIRPIAQLIDIRSPAKSTNDMEFNLTSKPARERFANLHSSAKVLSRLNRSYGNNSQRLRVARSCATILFGKAKNIPDVWSKENNVGLRDSVVIRVL